MRHLLALAVVCAAGLGLEAQQPTFRGSTLVVPLDVRVTDRNGRPITDLTAADFTVIEDKIPQRITQFVVQTYEPGEPKPLSIGTRFMDAQAAPPTQRTFLLVLGRGRLQYPGKGVDGAIHFVKNRLLPQDHVAVLALGRATPFTTDHGRILTVLERFKAQHEDVEATIRSATEGLAGVYGTREYPRSVTSAIDRVFGADLVPLPEGVVPNAQSNATRELRAASALLRETAVAGMNLLPEVMKESEILGASGSFDDYVATTVQSGHDLEALYRGIDYLKYLDGEKQIVFFSPSGVTLPSADDDRSLAAVAADARVVMNFVTTGGTGISGFNWANATSQRVSELTGGYFTSLSYASQAMDRIDNMSRHSYLLGYSPTNITWDGKYRRVEVRVNRPGARVYYRHGYFGHPSRPPMNRAAVVSLTRISSASRISQPITDIGLADVFASPTTGPGGARQTLIEFTLKGDRIHFTQEGDQWLAKFDIAVFIGDERQLLVGQTWHTAELKIDAARHARYVQGGLPITLRIPIRRSASNAKIIVYDYGTDLLGSISVRVRRK